jgi:hypothetical protein
MDLFDKFFVSHRVIIPLRPHVQYVPLKRFDDRIETKRQGVKRTFARIMVPGAEALPGVDLLAIDQLFAPRDQQNNIIMAESGVLDYSPLFREFAEVLDMKGMPRKFRYLRIAGYMVSFEFDPELENESRKVGHGKLRAGPMLDKYMNSGEGVRFHEANSFDVFYINGGEYGKFLFSGYARPPKDGVVDGGAPPAAVVENRLFADNVKGLHSDVVYDRGRINMPTAYNKAVF